MLVMTATTVAKHMMTRIIHKHFTAADLELIFKENTNSNAGSWTMN